MIKHTPYHVAAGAAVGQSARTIGLAYGSVYKVLIGSDSCVNVHKVVIE